MNKPQKPSRSSSSKDGEPNLLEKIGDLLWVIMGGVAILLVVASVYLDDPSLQKLSSQLLILGGTLQILLGVGLSRKRRRILEKIVKDEKAQPTTYVREVMQTRAIMRLLKKLKAIDPAQGAESWRQEIDKIIALYANDEAAQSSKVKRRFSLSQKRLAMGLLAASYNTFWGTAMIIVGTIMAG